MLPGPFWQFLLPGRIDLYIYELAGAAMFGYAVALFGALRRPRWVPVRLVVLAVLVFNLGSLWPVAPRWPAAPAPSIYVIAVVALGFVVLTATLLARHGLAPTGPPGLAPGLVGMLGIATLAATLFGLFPLFFPGVFGTFFGYQATDTFLYQQAGAATLGYAVMGVFELRSRHWAEVRWPLVMAAVFNGLSFVASLLALSTGQAGWLPVVVTPAHC